MINILDGAYDVSWALLRQDTPVQCNCTISGDTVSLWPVEFMISNGGVNQGVMDAFILFFKNIIQAPLKCQSGC